MALQSAVEETGLWKTTDQDFHRHRRAIYQVLIRSAILSERWWDNPETIPANGLAEATAEDASGDLRAHRTLLRHLIGSRRPGQPAPWVFTTNYDMALEWAAETIGAPT